MMHYRAAACLLLALANAADGQSLCDPDGVQASGSIYRICMPSAAEYNNRLVVWAHGFVDATRTVGIPEEQLCFDGVCLNDLYNALGYGFATNSYSKTGLAIVEGAADILDLIEIYADEKGMPEKVYLVGASAGGLITVLLAEQMPSSVDGAVAACGPIGDFRRQLDYFGNARVLFEVFWPGLFPGKPFDPHPDVVGSWPEYFDDVVWPTISAEKDRLNEWFRVAELAVDAAATPASFETTARDVLSYTTLNSRDAEDTLGGFPFDNATTFYDNTRFPLLVNARVPRFVADAAALEEIEAHYQTSGNVDAPVVTLHTKLDQQVPYFHEPLYIKKTIAGDHFLTDHFHVPIARYGHCNFTAGEGLFAFALMLLYAGDLSEIQGVGELLSEAQLADFERLAIEHGLPYRIGGEPGVIRD